MRINKYLSETGIVSRRGADKWIEEGKVTIMANWRLSVVRLQTAILCVSMGKK